MLTVMTYLLPPHGVLPMHCLTNYGTDENDVAIFFDLLGTVRLIRDWQRESLSVDPYWRACLERIFRSLLTWFPRRPTLLVRVEVCAARMEEKTDLPSQGTEESNSRRNQRDLYRLTVPASFPFTHFPPCSKSRCPLDMWLVLPGA